MPMLFTFKIKQGTCDSHGQGPYKDEGGVLSFMIMCKYNNPAGLVYEVFNTVFG